MVDIPYALEQPGRWLIARFPEQWNMLSWSVVNGGFQRTKTAAWLYLKQNEIAGVTDPVDWMRGQMYAQGVSDALGFMTSRREHAWVEASASEADCSAWAVGTLGMSNALRAGDPQGVWTFGTMNMLSWSVVNGGFQRTKTAAWLYLKQNEIAGVTDPVDWMRGQMYAQGVSDALGFMTSRREHAWAEASASEADCNAWAVGTVGMSNALRAGDPQGVWTFGTMNMLVAVSIPLTMEAALEALCLVSEAKALAVVESGVRSIVSKEPASGTGTDYMALAWPMVGASQLYAGKHTAVGAAVGRAAYLAVKQGIQQWQHEQGSTA